jgi:hypothetical protein
VTLNQFLFVIFQVEREKGADEEDDEEKFTELQRGEDEKIKLDGLKLAGKKDIRKLDETGIFKKPGNLSSKKSGKRESESLTGEKRKMSALEEIMKEEEERKKKSVRY